MKHATDKTLDGLKDLLVTVRSYVELREKKRGVFYRKSVAFLHFHEDGAGLFADIRISADFRRFAVNTPAERRQFELLLKKTLAPQFQEWVTTQDFGLF